MKIKFPLLTAMGPKEGKRIARYYNSIWANMPHPWGSLGIGGFFHGKTWTPYKSLSWRRNKGTDFIGRWISRAPLDSSWLEEIDANSFPRCIFSNSKQYIQLLVLTYLQKEAHCCMILWMMKVLTFIELTRSRLQFFGVRVPWATIKCNISSILEAFNVFFRFL